MKKAIYLIIIGFGFSQATSFAIYGVGEKIHNTDPTGIALGNSIFFSGNSKNISNGSPSSIWRSALTRFTVSSGMNYLINTQFPDQYNQNLTSFSLHFPIGNKKVFGFGLQPVYRTNKLNIRDRDFQFIGVDESITGKPMAFKSNYSIDGGISELFVEYSRKLSPDYSGGIKYSFLFGNQFLNDELYIYDVNIDTSFLGGVLLSEFIEGDETLYAKAVNGTMTELNKLRKFSGSMLTMEGRYIGSNQEWVLSVSVNGKLKVETQNIYTTENYTTNFDNSSNEILSELGFGYLYSISENEMLETFGFGAKNNAGITMELHKKYPFNIPVNSALFNIMPPEENSIHCGSYYQISNPKIGYWNNLNVRGGLYYKELNFDGEIFLDHGATLGLGIEYLGNTQSIDLAFRIGRMENRIIDQMGSKYDEYISFHFSFTSGEKWFMKRRRK